MAVQIQLRNDTELAWTNRNPVLAEGEVGAVVDDTSLFNGKFKIGDGVNAWADLGYSPGAHGIEPGGKLHSPATTSDAGFMSATDKSKLDGISSGANAGITALTGDVTTSGVGSVSSSIAAPVVTGKVLTGLSLPAWGQIGATDTILQALAKLASLSMMTPLVISSDVTVPDGHVFFRPLQSTFEGTMALTLLGTAELRFI